MRALPLCAAALPLLLLLLLSPLAIEARGYNGDLLRPFGISAQSNQDALLSFNPVGVSTFSPRLSLPADDSACCDCVHSVGRHILDSAMQLVKETCANVSCPVLKQRCEWIQEHQDEFTGVLAVQLRPLTDGYMYCMGNGTCDHPGVPKGDISSALFLADSASNPQLRLSQVAAAAPFVEKALLQYRGDKVKSSEQSDSDIVAFARRIGNEFMKVHDRFGRRRVSRESQVSAQAEAKDSDSGSDSALAVDSTVAGHPKKRSCHSCLRHGVRWVLKKSMKHLKKACEETKCPHFQKFCAWAKEHKEFVKGMMYAHVQPWKMATGYCAGNGSCRKRHSTDSSETAAAAANGQSAASAPFNMGEKDTNEKEEEEDKKIEPIAPAKPVIIGGGKHDHVRHGKILH